MTKLECWAEIQFFRLSGDSLYYGFDVVSKTACPQSGQTVEYLATCIISKVATISGDDDAWFFLELPVTGKGHPVGIKLIRCKFFIHGRAVY